MNLELFPKAVTLFPGDEQSFTARATPPPPMWADITDGLVQSDYSLRLSWGAQPFVEGSGAHQLVGGIGSIEFALTSLCLPTSTGSLQWTAILSATVPWEYRVIIKAATIEIRDQAGTLLTTLNRTQAVGDRFKIEVGNAFRLFINDVLQHSITTFASAVTYPATYKARLTLPVSVDPATIPAPLLSGDWQLRSVVTFTTPDEGSLSTNGPALATVYSDGDTPGIYALVGQIDPGVDVWMEDAVPTGGTQITGGGDAWTFGNTSPTPQTGTLRHKSSNAAGTHFHGFHGATATLQINPGDSLYCWVFPDTTNPPQEIMLEFATTRDAPASLPFRAYWGANLINVGLDGTPQRRRIGDLPPLGQWTRLEFPVSLLDLQGLVLNGMDFVLFDGVCSFDQVGKIPNLQIAEAVITIPPLQITGDLVRDVSPGSVTRFQTNYDVADVPPTWSILSGGGSFNGNEFTAPAIAGLTIVRATAATGNQVADLVLNISAVITPSFTFVGPGETIDWGTSIPFKPSFVAAGAVAEGTGAVVPGLPAGIQPKDILRLFVESANEAVATPTGGWAVSADSPQGTGTAAGATSTRLSIFWLRVPESGTVSAPTVADPGEHVIAQIFAYRDCIGTGNPWDVTAGNTGASSTAVSIPGDTTTAPNCLIEAAVAHQTDTATPQVSGYVNADLTNLTERTDVATTQGNGGGFAVVTGEKAVAGAYAATTATLANASVQGRISTALKPNPLVWTANAGSINSATGNWTAPASVGQTAKITASNGVFSVTRDVLVLPIFPLNDPTLPLTWTRNRTSLISMSEDRKSRIVREKSGIFDDYEIKFTQRTLAESDAVDAFWDAQGYGKLFILEDKVRDIRKVGWFDSAINHEGYDTCAIDLSFRFVEASL
jgi:hypothetical protein